ncbi:MAG: hypothetical protein RL101_485 [Actinomycetota bacterium]
MDFNAKTILVIGASGALGSAIAEKLTAAGATVLGTASSNETATRIPDSVSMKLLLNLEQSQSIETLCNYLISAQKLDGIFVASGCVGFGRLQETSNANANRLMAINHDAPTQILSKLVAALNPDSFIAAITGVVAEKSFPGMAAYSASKAALSTWLQVANLELKKLGISVIEYRPGHTETGLAGRAIFGIAPAMPTGMSTDHVTNVMLEHLIRKTPIVSSLDF